MNTAPIIDSGISSGLAPGGRPRMTFAGALCANMLNMIGVGPFITIPLALAAMGGPQALLGWLLGALLCLCDGLVWAELGSALPRSGGSFHYLREAFGPQGLGRLFGFLYLWQMLLIGPMGIASGTVGMAHYLTWLIPGLSARTIAAIAATVCIVNLALLWRDVRAIGMLSIGTGVIVIGACLWIIASGAVHFDAARAFSFPPHAFALDGGFWMGLGAATLIGVYDYGGYNTICMLGDEVEAPRRTIPRAVLLSIVLVALLYVGLNLAILGVLPWRQAMQSQAVVADFMAAIYGPIGGRIVTVLIVIAGWASALMSLLGTSRVPFAAARAGDFLAVFARTNARGDVPAVSLLVVGLASAVGCLVSLDTLIAVMIVVQTLFQNTAQCIAIVLLRRRHRGATPGHFRMPLYPVPVIVALAGWAYIVTTARPLHIVAGAAMILAGAAIFLLVARRTRQWPFSSLKASRP